MDTIDFLNKASEVPSILKEKDPNGLSQHSLGAKLDSDKPNLDLVLGSFSKALLEVGKVGTFGANKYTKNGWLFVENGMERYSSAELRHYFYEKNGETFDPDSNLLHAAHKAWNALAYLELLIRSLDKIKT